MLAGQFIQVLFPASRKDYSYDEIKNRCVTKLGVVGRWHHGISYCM